MNKPMTLLRLALRSIKRGFAPQPPHEWEVSLNHARREEAGRVNLGKRMLPTLSDAARKRFSETVLIKLLGNGWTEGRRVDAEKMAVMQQAAQRPFPPRVTDILSEYGGLRIYSGIGRYADIGTVKSELTSHLHILEALVGQELHPIGFSNLLDDDGVLICADGSGHIFVDGESGHKDPGSCRIDFMATTFDRALEILMGDMRKYDSWPGLPASGGWNYDDPQARHETATAGNP